MGMLVEGYLSVLVVSSGPTELVLPASASYLLDLESDIRIQTLEARYST